MRYFAYGSNLDPVQMRSRCPSSVFVAIARLTDHALAFTRFAPRRGCGVADVVARRGSTVWGVVYDLSDADGRRLDAFEGFVPGRSGNGYRRVAKTVVARDADAQALRVVTYEVCERRTEHVPPDRRYLAHLLAGAAAWNLPSAYVSTLRAVPLA